MKTNSRRIKTHRLPAGYLVVILFLISSCLLFAEPSISLQQINPGYYSLTFVQDHMYEVLANVENDMTAGIRYEIKIYQLGRGILRTLGRSLLYSDTIEYEGYWDAFYESYIIEAGKTMILYKTAEAFLADFFSLGDVFLDVELPDDKNHEIHVSSTLFPIKFLPPLNIMAPFQGMDPDLRTNLRYEIPGAEGGGL